MDFPLALFPPPFFSFLGNFQEKILCLFLCEFIRARPKMMNLSTLSYHPSKLWKRKRCSFFQTKRQPLNSNKICNLPVIAYQLAPGPNSILFTNTLNVPTKNKVIYKLFKLNYNHIMYILL
jgi:hypothetical protein